jgi:hypothetical protein
LKFNPSTGKIEGSSSNAALTITSDELKSAINSDTNFAKYIDGKMVSANTSIKQLSDETKAKIDLIANFKGTGASISISSFKDVFTDAVKSQIDLKADSIKVSAKEMAVNAVFKASGTAVFDRVVNFKNSVQIQNTLTVNNTLSTGSNQITCGIIKSSGDIDTSGGSIHVTGKSKSIYIGGKEVALKENVLAKSDFTQKAVEDTLRGDSDMGSYLRNKLKGGHDNFNNYIKAIIDEKYIKSIITSAYIEGIITGKYIRDTLKGGSAWGVYLRDSIGCTVSGNVVSLKSFVEDKAKDHTHTVKVTYNKTWYVGKGSHSHTISDDGKKAISANAFDSNTEIALDLSTTPTTSKANF